MKLRILPVLVALVAAAGVSACSSTPDTPGSPSAAGSSAAPVVVNHMNELSAFIAKRAADQGKAAGAVMITSGLKSVDVNGTEYTIVAEWEPLLIAADIHKQVAYMVGRYDAKATKVTVKTPGGQELFSGAPPAESITGTSAP